MNYKLEQMSFKWLLVNHLYVGIAITLFYIWISPNIIASGYPGGAVLLLAELIILLPLVAGHLTLSSRRSLNRYSFKAFILFQKRISLKSFLIWTVGGLLVSVLIYIPLYPLSLYLRETAFNWLPEWYFNPSYGTEDASLMANLFLFAMVIDGLIGPIAEELFFRGYLLPRMAYLKNWAPIVNGCLFGLYHFWQPHNLLAIMGLGVVLSFVVWKTKCISGYSNSLHSEYRRRSGRLYCSIGWNHHREVVNNYTRFVTVKKY